MQLRTRWMIMLALGLTTVACGDDDGGTDASVETDAGDDATTVDAGDDALVMGDTSGERDAGDDAPMVDAGDDAPVVDAGDDAATVDAGNDAPPTDAGDDAPDAGPIATGGAYFYGDFITNNTYAVGYYDDVADMAEEITLPNLDGRDVNAVALSPDGSQLAVSGHNTDGNTDFVYLYDTMDLSMVATLVDTTDVGHVVDINQLVFSPDGTLLAVRGDLDSNNEDAAYVVATDGSGMVSAVSPIPPEGGDVRTLVWVNSTILAYAGDVMTNGVSGLWSVDTTAPVAVDLLEAASLSTTQGVVTNYLQVDGMGRIYFKSDHVTDELVQLFRVDAEGTTLEQVPDTVITSGASEASIAGFGIAPDGGQLAFAISPADGENGQVYVVMLAGGVASPITNFSMALTAPRAAGANDNAITWSPDQMSVAVAGDWPLSGDDVDDAAGLFIVSVSDTTVVRVARSTVESMDAFDGLFSSDGSRLFIRGDLVMDGETDLLVTSDFVTVDQDVVSMQRVASPSNGDVFGIIPTP